MVTRTTAFPPGTPCWVDVFSSDPDKAAGFYAALFGWRYEEGAPEFGGYGTFYAGDHRVAGIMRNDGQGGNPDVWSTYLATKDAADCVERAKNAGATVIGDLMSVGDLGTMAVLMDPVGGVFGLWQAGTHTGFTKYNEPGCVIWDEYHSKDFAATKQFYGDLFGWEWQVTSDTDDFRYVTGTVEGEPAVGMMDSASLLPEQVPSHWAIYFSVDDVDAAAQQVSASGGSVLRPPETTPFGRIADVADPTGAQFKLHMDSPQSEPSVQPEQQGDRPS